MHLKTDIIKKFGIAAKSYDNFADIQQETSRYLSEICYKNIDNHIASILDIGAGTGQTSLEFQTSFKNADFTLLDFSPQMLEKAETKIKSYKTILADAETFNFTQKYDLCISNLTVQWFDNFKKFFEKIIKHCDYFAFSTLLNSSFEQYKNIFKSKSILPPTFKYFTEEDIYNFISPKAVIFQDKRNYTKIFANAKNAAKHFKNIGANVSSNQNREIVSEILKHESELALEYHVYFALIKS